MLKKLAALALSLLICLSLSTNQAKAINPPEPAAPPVQSDVLYPGNPDESGDSGIMPLSEDPPTQGESFPREGEL